MNMNNKIDSIAHLIVGIVLFVVVKSIAIHLI